MSYIGKQPEFTQFPSKFFNGDGSAMTVSLDYAPPNQAALLVFISGVRQDTSAYTLSGTSLTFTGSVESGTNNVQVVHLGLTVEVPTPADDTITTAKIQDDAVTVAKLANSINTDIDANTAKTGITSGQATAITANTAKVTNATHTGDVTGATALTIATDAVDIAMLSATGTADATTFLRGDNSWTAAGGDNTPAFQAYLTADFTLPFDSTTKVPIDGEDFDADGIYDNSTNYRFTVPAGEGGKYMLYYATGIKSNANSSHIYSWIELRKNGSAVTYDWFDFSSNNGRTVGFSQSIVHTLVATDYVELWAYINDSGSATGIVRGGGGTNMRKTVFGAYKMIGL